MDYAHTKHPRKLVRGVSSINQQLVQSTVLQEWAFTHPSSSFGLPPKSLSPFVPVDVSPPARSSYPKRCWFVIQVSMQRRHHPNWRKVLLNTSIEMSMCRNGHTVFLLATAMKTISCLQNGTMWWKGRIPVSPIHSPFLWFYLLIPLPSCWQKMEAWFLASFLIPSPFQRSSTIHSCSCNSIGRCITSILSSSPNPLASSSTWSRWAFLPCPLRNATSTDYPFWNGCALRLVIRSHHAKSSTSTQTSSSIPSFLKCHIDCTPSSMGRMSYPLSSLTSSTYSLPTCTARKMCLI